MSDAPAADPSAYVPPKVWTWNKDSGGRFAGINRPIAGPTHEAELPVGRMFADRYCRTDDRVVFPIAQLTSGG